MDYSDKNVGVTVAVASISPRWLMDQVRGRLRLEHYSLRGRFNSEVQHLMS